MTVNPSRIGCARTRSRGHALLNLDVLFRSAFFLKKCHISSKRIRSSSLFAAVVANSSSDTIEGQRLSGIFILSARSVQIAGHPFGDLKLLSKAETVLARIWILIELILIVHFSILFS
jgi:hypothetical protein